MRMGINAKVMGLGLGLLALGSIGCVGSAAKKVNETAHPGRGFVLRTVPGTDRSYGVYIPNSYDGTRAYPVILFLHGGFEGGSNPAKAFGVGLGPVIAERMNQFEYIVVVPQSRGDWGAQTQDLANAYKALEDVKSTYRTDPSRVILTGLSFGGYGVWALAEKHPHVFAALVPLCGFDKVDAVPSIRHHPIWMFHNTMDPIVFCGESREMEAALKKAGANVRLTTYSAFGHDVWERAYRETELWTWIGQQRLPSGMAGARKKEYGNRTAVFE